MGARVPSFWDLMLDDLRWSWCNNTRNRVLITQSCLILCDPWTVAYQAPLSVGFPRQEYWSGLPFSSLGYLPNPGTEPRSAALQADFLPSEPPGKPRKVHSKCSALEPS